MIVALAFLLTGNANAQESKTIKGVVRDATGEPLIGASVIEKGTNNGVITDVEGSFILTVPTDATLSIAYMGYATREIHLAKRKKQGDLRVTLREDSQQLKEVVVTAMGIKKDTKRLGYAVSTIESDEIVKAGATNFASAMYGKAPGIRITQTQGGSAGAVSINVRGLTSITGNNQPLIILDGVPIRNGGTGKSTDFAEFGNDGQIRSNGLVDINPEDIESVSVLKGASATALYGSEAANGAVVITSKRAKSGKRRGGYHQQTRQKRQTDGGLHRAGHRQPARLSAESTDRIRPGTLQHGIQRLRKTDGRFLPTHHERRKLQKSV